jgi:hypothetical protein
VRAARAAGIRALVCDIWRPDTTADAIAASVAVQQHHVPHHAIHVARRIRDLKNGEGLTLEQLAARTGIPLTRIKRYQSLLLASDELLTFFTDVDVPLATAVAMARYGGEAGEAKTRQLIADYRKAPIGREELEQRRERLRRPRVDGSANEAADGAVSQSREQPVLGKRFVMAFRKNPSGELRRLSAALAELGFRLVPVDDRHGSG